MKILFYSSYFHPYISGLTQSPTRVLSKLSKKHTITVLTFSHEKDLKAQELWDNMHILRMPYLFKISKGYISIQSFFYFFRETTKSDVVFINLPNVEALPLVFIAKLCGKKIISLYNCEVDLGNNFIQKFISNILNMSVFIQLLLSNSIVAYPDYIVQQWIGRFFRKKTHETLPVITKFKTNDSAIQKFRRMKNGNIWIGFVGRIAREKGIEYLIKAVETLRANRHSGLPRIHLVFAGPPPQEVAGEMRYFNKIQKLARNKNISLTFFGKLSENELAAFYKSLDLLVLPSTNSTEAFGMVQAEAMLHGTPVVASNLPGVKLPITLTQMGILVAPKNTNELTLAIKKVLQNRGNYTNSTLVKTAEKVFDPKNIYHLYERLLTF